MKKISGCSEKTERLPRRLALKRSRKFGVALLALLDGECTPEEASMLAKQMEEDPCLKREGDTLIETDSMLREWGRRCRAREAARQSASPG